MKRFSAMSLNNQGKTRKIFRISTLCFVLFSIVILSMVIAPRINADPADPWMKP